MLRSVGALGERCQTTATRIRIIASVSSKRSDVIFSSILNILYLTEYILFYYIQKLYTNKL